MEIIIKPRAPFDFASTARFLRFTEAEAVDTFHENIYRRAIHLDNHLHLLKVSSSGTRSRPRIVATLEERSAATISEKQLTEKAEKIVRQIFSTEHDLRKLRARVANDPLMRELELNCRGLRMTRWPSLFEALTISILLQQISTSVALTLKRRLVERFGETLVAGDKIFFAFPRASRLSEASADDLRALGLTNAKAVSIIELARHVMNGELDETELALKDDENLIARLTRLRGVGRWTAEWALMLHFGRTNIFPANDLALRGVVVKYYNKGVMMSEREIRILADTLWGEWASYAAIYFLAGMRASFISL